jgi:hypothetical protein
MGIRMGIYLWGLGQALPPLGSRPLASGSCPAHVALRTCRLRQPGSWQADQATARQAAIGGLGEPNRGREEVGGDRCGNLGELHGRRGAEPITSVGEEEVEIGRGGAEREGVGVVSVTCEKERPPRGSCVCAPRRPIHPSWWAGVGRLGYATAYPGHP